LGFEREPGIREWELRQVLVVRWSGLGQELAIPRPALKRLRPATLDPALGRLRPATLDPALGRLRPATLEPALGRLRAARRPTREPTGEQEQAAEGAAQHPAAREPAARQRLCLLAR
jgi:hypothetical protein